MLSKPAEALAIDSGDMSSIWLVARYASTVSSELQSNEGIVILGIVLVITFSIAWFSTNRKLICLVAHQLLKQLVFKSMVLQKVRFVVIFVFLRYADKCEKKSTMDSGEESSLIRPLQEMHKQQSFIDETFFETLKLNG
ncbi:MAG: hypothetical protein IPJ31_12000 [Bacteroidetes bacterium]|nr:hypothetical protein [Bacteroidota bacterium]